MQNKVISRIDELLAERNPDYKGVLEPIFVKSQLSATQVAGLINLLSKEKFSKIRNPQSDIYGGVYESKPESLRWLKAVVLHNSLLGEVLSVCWSK
jgi:hypothetical protein